MRHGKGPTVVVDHLYVPRAAADEDRFERGAAVVCGARRMTSQARRRRILTLALPIIGGMLSQNLLNLVDTAMVGTLGDAALAAVGIGGFANFMATALVTGFSSGVQAMSSRRLGAGRTSETAVPLNGALMMAVAFAIPWSLLLYGLVPSAFPYLSPDPDVVAAGVPYLQARFWAIAAVGINFSFRGYWNGVDRSRLYMTTLVFMHVCNIFLNWVFIFGNLGAPAMGATGAGIASAVATYLGSAYYFAMGFRHALPNGFLRGLPDGETLRTMLRLAVPMSIQQLLFSAGFTTQFWIIGQVGTAETAAANVLINVMLVAILPGIALGMSATTLVGQALGRKDPDDAYRWGWDVVRVAVVVLAALGLPMVLLPDLILSGFLHDPVTRDLARLPLQAFGLCIGFNGIGLVLQNALLGAGASRLTMVVSVSLQWGLFLPAAYLVGPLLGYGLLGIWLAQIGYFAIQGAVFAVLWRHAGWAKIEV